jgi:hypothetical protein
VKPPGATQFKETMMETSSTCNDNGSERSTPTRAVATLLGVYTALYLTIVGAIHFASSPDAAAAVAPEPTSAPITVAAMPAERSAHANDLAPGAPIVPDEPDNARECTGGIDTSCIYD